MSIPQTPSPLSNILASKTYNAAWFSGATKEAQITAAIAAAVTDGALYVYVPASMLPYTAASVTFNSTIRMICEGGDHSVIDIRAYGATGNNVADDTVAFTSAIAHAVAIGGGTIQWPYNFNVKITSTIVIGDTTPIVIQGCGRTSKITKGFNGDMINLGKMSVLREIYLDGNGATYTGRGILMTTGAIDLTSYRRLEKIWIFDTVSYPVEFSGANAGYGSQIIDCMMSPIAAGADARFIGTQTLACIKMPSVVENGNRSIRGGWFNGPVCDCDHAGNLLIQGVESSPPIFGPNHVKVRCIGCRFANGAAWSIDGTDTVFVGNAYVASTLTFSATCNGVVFRGNVDSNGGTGTTVVDNANGLNLIDIAAMSTTIYVPTWTTSGGAPAVGAGGSLGGKWSRRGQHYKVDILLQIGGAGLALGGANWTFTLPKTALRNSVGPVFCSLNALFFFTGTAFIPGGSNTLTMAVSGGTAKVGNATPGAWANGDFLVLEVEYEVQ